MALDFPANPTTGQIYGSYVYDAIVGVWKSAEESASPAVVSSTKPENSNPGDIWVDSSDGISYVRYDDGTSAQWIEMISSGVPAMESKADKTYVDSQDLLKANLSGGNTFTGSQTFNTPIAVSSGGTGSASGINLVPTGCIMMWYTSTPPSGWLLCDGQSTAGHTALAAIVGANVPNLQGRVPVGKNSGTFGSIGSTGGAESVALTIGQVPNVTGGFTFHGSEGGGPAWNAYGAFGGSPVNGSYYRTPGGSTYGASSIYAVSFNNGGGGGAHTNLQPYIVLNYIIKT